MIMKIFEDYNKIEVSDDLFTQSLIALEKYEYEKALNILDDLLTITENIEQRAGALFLLTLANAKNDMLTDTMLSVIYYKS